MNTNTMPEEEWAKKSIYNYKALFTVDPDFIQVYLFDESQL